MDKKPAKFRWHLSKSRKGRSIIFLTSIFFWFTLFTCPLHAQWIATNGPLGGFIYSFASDDSNLFVGTSDGVYRSTNNGGSWNRTYSGLNLHLGVVSMVMNGTDLYAGTAGGGIFKSSDLGNNWAVINTGLTNLAVYSLAIKGTNIFAGTFGGGVFISSDNGATWSEVNNGLNISFNTMVIYSLYAVGTKLYAGTSNGVFVTADDGVSWTALPNGLANNFPNPRIYQIITHGTDLFASTSFGVFRSSDEGVSWTQINTGLTHTNVTSLASDGINLYAGTRVSFSTSTGGIFTSSNNGTSWLPASIGLPNLAIISLRRHGSSIFAGTFGAGLFSSVDNGATWIPNNNNLKATSVVKVKAIGTDMFAFVRGGGVFRTSNNGITWSASNSGLTNLDIWDIQVEGTNAFIATNGGGVFRSLDGGQNWTSVNSGLTSPYVTTLAIRGNIIVAGTSNSGAFISTNSGDTWSSISGPWGGGGNIRSLLINGSDIYVGTSKVFLSTNNGGTWADKSAGLPLSEIHSFAVKDGFIFASVGNSGVYRSSDNAESWLASNNGISGFGNFSNRLSVIGNGVFRGALVGTLFVSVDNGANWTSASTGIPNEDFAIGNVADVGGNLFVGVGSKGAWIRPLSEMISVPTTTITSFTPNSGSIGTTVTITGTNFDPVAANNTVKFNGVDAATPTVASATSLTVTVPTGATTGPISVTTLAGTGTSTTDFIVICTPLSPPTATNVSRCGDGAVTLTASGAIGTQEYRWHDVAIGGTSLSSITTFTTPSLTITTPYYVSIFDVATSCESNRTQVDAIINTPPDAPTGTPNSGCSGTNVTLNASGGSSGQYRWYTVATGGTPDATQTNDTFVSTTPLTANTSFWVSIHDGTCESTRTEVVATIIPLPTSPTVQAPEAVCPSANVLLVASGATGGQYRWYEGGSLITGATSNTYTLVNISVNRTFEVSVFDLCESPKTSVTATVVDCTLPPAKEPSVVGSSGDYFASANGSLAWTLGEVITETFTNGTKILTQGFHQPLAYIITGIPEEGTELAVYPNPTRDWLTIKTSVSGDYHIELSNLQGQKVVDQTTNGMVGIYQHKIDINGLTPAVYMLRITNTHTGKTSTFKISKY